MLSREELKEQGIRYAQALTIFGLIYYWDVWTGVLQSGFEMYISLPLLFHGMIASFFVGVVGADMEVEKLPERLSQIFFWASLVLTVVAMSLWINAQVDMYFYPTIVEMFIWLIAGLMVWYLGLIIVQNIVLSILQIDPEEERRRGVDDPYGDKHAQKILDEDEQ